MGRWGRTRHGRHNAGAFLGALCRGGAWDNPLLGWALRGGFGLWTRGGALLGGRRRLGRGWLRGARAFFTHGAELGHALLAERLDACLPILSA